MRRQKKPCGIFSSWVKTEHGFSAAEIVLVLLVALGLILMVARIIQVGADRAASNAQAALAGQSIAAGASSGGGPGVSVSADNTTPQAPPGVSVDQNMKEAANHWSPFWFRDQVKNKGPWDYKQQGRQYEDFGNFNYGATGRAFGFPEDVLLRQAGIAQRAAGTSKPEWGDPGTCLGPICVGGTPPYGDDPADAEMIKRGFEYYDKSKEGNN